MELLVCEKCDTIVYPWELGDERITVLPHHRYMVLGRRCMSCGHEVLKRRWSMEYALKESNESNEG
jgi:hypothetical protein